MKTCIQAIDVRRPASTLSEAIGRALAMCGYGTLQAPEFDEQERLADTPVEKDAN